MSAYRETLNAWAVRQLETRSRYRGPYQVMKVDVEYTEAYRYSEYTEGDAEMFVRIRFRDPKGDEMTWCSDTQTSVDILNELLALEGEVDADSPV